MEKKQEYRNRYKTVRNGMSRHDVDSKSAQICRNILDSDIYREAHYLYAYYPLENEVDVRLVAETAWQEGKSVAFPKVFGEAMRFFEVKDFGQLTEGAFGVMEPVENAGAVPVDWMDDKGNCGGDESYRAGAALSGRKPGSPLLVLVPGVAFDRQGNRMGYGKGYYDRYFDSFAESQKRGPSVEGPQSITLLGVSYACQIADRLPVKSHDLTVPYLITEDGIVLSNRSCG